MRKYNRLILLLAIARFVLPYLLQNPAYEPHRDEFLYLAEGQHVAWGFLEIPPLLSLFAWLTNVLGNSIFWIKFWPNLFGSLTFVICARILTYAGGKKLALWMLFFVFIFGAWLRMFFLFQPNAPEIFFSALMAYGIFRHIQTGRNKYLYLFGIATGLGLLTKYSVAFWAVSLVVGLLLTKNRRVFLNKHFYLAMTIGGIIFLPNLVWQWSHNFPVIHHMQELKETQLEYISAGEFLQGEFLMYLPVFYIWLTGLIFCFTVKGNKYLAFGIAFLAMQSIMVALHGKAYYTAGSFTIMFALGAFYVEKICLASANIFRYSAISFSILTGLLFWPILLPVAAPAQLAAFYKTMHIDKTGTLKWEDLKDHPLPQDFADMLGWKEIAQGVAKAYATLDSAERKNLILWCDNYGQAGAVNYYRNKFHLPEAYSANGSFLFWLPTSTFPQHVILVSENDRPLDDPLIRQFGYAKIIDSVNNKFAREYKTTILVLKYPSEKLIQILKQRIDMQRDNFTKHEK